MSSARTKRRSFPPPYSSSSFSCLIRTLVSWLRSSHDHRYQVHCELRSQNDTRNQGLLLSLRFGNSQDADIEIRRNFRIGTLDSQGGRGVPARVSADMQVPSVKNG